MGMALVMNHVINYYQRGLTKGNVVLAVHFTVKAIVHYNKMKCFNFRSGHAMQVAKHIQEDWPIVLQ